MKIECNFTLSDMQKNETMLKAYSERQIQAIYEMLNGTLMRESVYYLLKDKELIYTHEFYYTRYTRNKTRRVLGKAILDLK